MGTSIYSKIVPKKIDPKDWERVYYDALKIAEYGQLAGLAEKDIDGYKVQNLVPVGTTYKDHWNVDGDLLTGSCIETFNMYKDLSIFTIDFLLMTSFPAFLTGKLRENARIYICSLSPVLLQVSSHRQRW